MEARIARLESDVAHLRSDVAEIKVDVRALRDRMDKRIDHLEANLYGKLDSLDSQIDGKFTWLMSMQVAFAVGLLGVMARGFGWI